MAFLILASLAFLTGCETDRQTIARAEHAKAENEAVAQAAEILARQNDLPPWPPECTEKEKAGVSRKDKADIAIVKYDQALTRANEKPVRCAGWYETVRQAHRRGTRSGGLM